ncbi:MAG: hypothetical protein ACE5LB_08530 [Acidiferrobacterales bacterium]
MNDDDMEYLDDDEMDEFAARILGANPPTGDVEQKRKENVEKQKRENYEITIGGRGEELSYRSGSKVVTAAITWINGLRLYKNSFTHWSDGTPLSKGEYELVLNRICEYLSCEVKGGPILEE